MSSKRRSKGKSQNGRLLWSAGGRRLWDREGMEWESAGTEVDRVEAERILRSADVPVAVSVGSSTLRWLDGGERMSVWAIEIAPNFHDVAGWRPPVGAPGQLPFHATLWRRGEHRLLLITDHD